MGLPKIVQSQLQNLDKATQRDFKREFDKRRKSTMMAYIAWLLLGWHYLYLGKIGFQLAFWLTAGFLFVGWVIDFFRIPSMVSTFNDDVARSLMVEYRSLSS